MERAEPALFPQWYKAAAKGGAAAVGTGAGIASISSTAHPDERGSGFFPRNGLSVVHRGLPLSRGNVGLNGSVRRDNDLNSYVDLSLPSSRGNVGQNGSVRRDSDSNAYGDRSLPSSRGSVGVNGSAIHNKDSNLYRDRSLLSSRGSVGVNGSLRRDNDSDSHSRLSVGDRGLPSRGSSGLNGSVTRNKGSDPYINFGISRRRDRKREVEPRDRDKVRDGVPLADNGFEGNSKVSRSVGGRQVDMGIQTTGGDKRNVVVSRGNVIGSLGKSSFEKDFPSLKEKQRESDGVSSCRISNVVQSVSSGSYKATVSDHVGQIPNATKGLSMAEALVQEPQVHTLPQIDADKQRIEEMNLTKVKRLIPLTPLMPKSSVSKSSEKSKSRGAKGDLTGIPKVAHHSSQLVNHAPRAPLRPDIPKIHAPLRPDNPKIHHPGNFQLLTRDGISISPTSGNFKILTRDGNNISPTSKDVPTANGAVCLTSAGASAASLPIKTTMKPELKSDNKEIVLDKKPPSQAQRRNDFFNALRKKTPADNSSAGCEPGFSVSSPGSPADNSSAGCEPGFSVSSAGSPVDNSSAGCEPGFSVFSSGSPADNSSAGSEPGFAVSPSGSGKSGELSSGSDNLSAGCESSFAASSSGSGKCAEQSSGSIFSNPENHHPASNSCLNCCTENGTDVTGDLDACKIPERFLLDNGAEKTYEPAIDDEKEAALLKLFGWEEDAREEALTTEEIDTFLKKYEKQTPSLKLPLCKFHVLMADLLRQGVGDRAGGSSTACTAEA